MHVGCWRAWFFLRRPRSLLTESQKQTTKTKHKTKNSDPANPYIIAQFDCPVRIFFYALFVLATTFSLSALSLSRDADFASPACCVFCQSSRRPRAAVSINNNKQPQQQRPQQRQQRQQAGTTALQNGCAGTGSQAYLVSVIQDANIVQCYYRVPPAEASYAISVTALCTELEIVNAQGVAIKSMALLVKDFTAAKLKAKILG